MFRKFSVERILASPDDLESVVNFENEVIHASGLYSASERESMSESLRNYLMNCSHKFLYRCDGEFVAGLYFWDGLVHPKLGVATTHIGFLGIKQTIQNHELRQALKQDFINQLSIAATTDVIAGKISATNLPALRLAQAMGRTPTLIEIEKKTE